MTELYCSIPGCGLTEPAHYIYHGFSLCTDCYERSLEIPEGLSMDEWEHILSYWTSDNEEEWQEAEKIIHRYRPVSRVV